MTALSRVTAAGCFTGLAGARARPDALEGNEDADPPVHRRPEGRNDCTGGRDRRARCIDRVSGAYTDMPLVGKGWGLASAFFKGEGAQININIGHGHGSALELYDEAFALGVKCIWGLGSIGSEAAVVRLGQLLACGNPVLEENARGQLVRIEKEGDGSAIRAAARRLLDAAHG